MVGGTGKSGKKRRKAPQQVSQRISASGKSTIQNVQQFSGGHHEHHYYGKPIASTPFMAPPLPSSFVPRPAIEESLKKRLLAKGNGPTGVLVVSAIHGIGGIGKSTVAAALMHDRQIQGHYRDGILWTTLGQKPDILAILSGWIQNLGKYDARPANIDAASSALRSLLYDKKMVLVIDDVWEPDHISPFLVSGPGSQVLITTRRVDVADRVGADMHYVDVMTPEESIKLLEAKVKRKFRPHEKKFALELAREVGFLPSALDLAATRVNHGSAWQDLTNAIHEEVARLEVLESPHDFRKGHLILEASYHLSLNFLRSEDEEAWRGFVWLGILPEDVTITERMASTLWGVGFEQSKDLLEMLSNDGLLLPGVAVYIKGRNYQGFRIHDILHDIARRLLVKLPPDGLGLSLVDAHLELLTRYRAKTSNNLWHTLPDDGYIHSYLTWHMQFANRTDAIRSLLQEETSDRKNGWYAAREALGQTAGYIDDINRAWSISKAMGSQEDQYSPANEFRYALFTSSLVSLAQKIQPALLSALVLNEIWTPAQALAYAFQVEDEIQLAEAIEELSPLIPLALLHQSAIVANRMSGEFARDRPISAISMALLKTGSFEGIDLMETIGSTSCREQAYVKAIDLLLMQDSKELANNLFARIKSNTYQAEGLIVMIPFAQEKELLTISQEVGVIFDSLHPNSEDYLNVSIHWVSKLASVGKMDEAWAILRKKIKDPYVSAFASIELLTYVKSKQEKTRIIEDILGRINDISGSYERAKVKAKLIPQLVQVGMSELANTFLENIKGWAGYYSMALADMSVDYPQKEKKKNFERALRAVQKISDLYPQARILAGLAHHLSKEKVREIFLGMQKILDMGAFFTAILELIPFLWDEELNQAISVVGTSKSEGYVKQAISQLPAGMSWKPVKTALSIINIVSGNVAKQQLVRILLYKVSTKEDRAICKRLFLDAIEGIADQREYDKFVGEIEARFSDQPTYSLETETSAEMEKMTLRVQESISAGSEITILSLDALINLFGDELSQREEITNFLVNSIDSLEDNSWKARLLLRLFSKLNGAPKMELMPNILSILREINVELEQASYIAYLIVSIGRAESQSELINIILNMQKTGDFMQWISILSDLYPLSTKEQKREINAQKKRLMEGTDPDRRIRSSNEEKKRSRQVKKSLIKKLEIGQSSYTLDYNENTTYPHEEQNDIFNEFYRLQDQYIKNKRPARQPLNFRDSFPLDQHQINLAGLYTQINENLLLENDYAAIDSDDLDNFDMTDIDEDVRSEYTEYGVLFLGEWLENIPDDLRGIVISKIWLQSFELEIKIPQELMTMLSSQVESGTMVATIDSVYSLKMDREKVEKGLRLLPWLHIDQRKSLLTDLCVWIWDIEKSISTQEMISFLALLSEHLSDRQLRGLLPKVSQFLKTVDSFSKFEGLPRLLRYLKFASKSQIHLLCSEFFLEFGHKPRSTLINNLDKITPLCAMEEKEFAKHFFKSVQDVFRWWQ